MVRRFLDLVHFGDLDHDLLDLHPTIQQESEKLSESVLVRPKRHVVPTAFLIRIPRSGVQGNLG